MSNIFVKFSHGESVIPNLLANCIFVMMGLYIALVEYLEKNICFVWYCYILSHIFQYDFFSNNPYDNIYKYLMWYYKQGNHRIKVNNTIF